MEKYVKVPIFPLTKYMTSKERREIPAPMKPVSFQFGDDRVEVDRVVECSRGASRKVGGRGFRYICQVSWTSRRKHLTKFSTIWFDDFLNEWFVEVLESKVPVDWDAATQLSDVDQYYEDGDFLDEWVTDEAPEDSPEE
ncbi:hypothetical protein LJC60_03470 [Ruminococcaceae bacterium OttesenSCG-928-D13]|nr:hypothetical protein [Ruminococcaceae bacterium OttesenSCG-928-D13]